MKHNFQKGKVIIAGAGPGDPELLTVKAARYLQKADVVLTDRLVSDVIMEEYVNPQAEVLYVGKQCRRGASTPQTTINELMVDYALQGKLVVRLKGGDVSIFSNILDELQTLVKHNIPYEVVPGITAASGAAAYSGIPLTARNYATAVRFLTCYKTEVISDAYWQELAATSDTLVFYMSAETADHVVAKLTANGIAEDKWIAVVEQATTPLQTIYTSNLYEFAAKQGSKVFKSPSLLIIGKVVQLHQQFYWLQNKETTQEYFAPVEDKAATYPKAERA
ncbi:uroporphyrinogen-III C-methyltransferase [Ilyomonas limi]|uniref:uroporphyrinogen-III C-methyltransferase n=1 Tax=Ilyomonas limi TaxID=2575867 RepID=A0A4U3L526_9BACT|nr:uroporphyrinogen-III C-methyltransferase [Ilyomonas limi]TKK70301.1 uroporphyrinogen-III C-methyltransferase [Ilyomonas limi]